MGCGCCGNDKHANCRGDEAIAERARGRLVFYSTIQLSNLKNEWETRSLFRRFVDRFSAFGEERRVDYEIARAIISERDAYHRTS